jgi:hypothetical protein
MGNGPSLNQTDLALLRNEYVWGTNRCYLLFDRIPWRPSFYTAVDNRVVPDISRDIRGLVRDMRSTLFFFPVAFRTKRILCSDKNVYWYNQVLLDESRLPGGMFSIDAALKVSSVRTVTIAALQLAVYLGFNPIYLIGCDTSYKIPSSVYHEKGDPDRLVSTQDDPNHFDPDYFGKGRKWHDPHVDRMIFHFQQAKTVCDELGVSVYNATVGGNLEVYPRVEFNDLF